MSATLDTSSFATPDFSPTDLSARTLTLSPADRKNPQLAMRLTASKPL